MSRCWRASSHVDISRDSKRVVGRFLQRGRSRRPGRPLGERLSDVVDTEIATSVRTAGLGMTRPSRAI